MKIDIPKNAELILETLNNAGHKAFVVGGCVRDSLMGKTPTDWDITTSATPKQTLELFSDGFKVVPTGLKHGTVTVITGGEPFEITTFRTEGEYKDSRRPEKVEFVDDISLDLSRRDFTVNAMAYNLKSGLVDMFGGRKHLAEKVISCVGEPDIRFSEDALRIMRALRFAACLEFEIEEKTALSLKKNKHLLGNIAAERINTEFVKLICGKKADDILYEYEEVFKEFLKDTEGCWEKAVNLSLKGETALEKISLFMTELYAGPEKVRGRMKNLRFDNASVGFAVHLAAHFKEVLPDTVTEMRKKLTTVPVEVLKLLCRVREDVSSAEILREIEEKNLCCKISQLDISGNDLINLGVEKGKTVGDVLEKLLNSVIEEKVENKNHALVLYVKELMEKGEI